MHIAADRCQSCVVTARDAATAKCTQLARVTFNYDSPTFHETVIEPGALPLFKTTGAVQFTLCPLKAPSLLIFHQQKPHCGTRWGHRRDGGSWGWAGVLLALMGQVIYENTPTCHPTASQPPFSPIRHKINQSIAHHPRVLNPQLRLQSRLG